MVVVIIILGILAVVAAPKFLDLNRDAKIAVLQGVKASIDTAAKLVYAKSAIAGVEKVDRDESVVVNGITIQVKYGYPETYGENGEGGLREVLELDPSLDICYSSTFTTCNSSGSSNVRIGFGIGEPTHDQKCYVLYVEPGGTGNSSNEKYLVRVETDDC